MVSLPDIVVFKILRYALDDSRLDFKFKSEYGLISRKVFEYLSRSVMGSLKIPRQETAKSAEIIRHLESPYCILKPRAINIRQAFRAFRDLILHFARDLERLEVYEYNILDVDLTDKNFPNLRELTILDPTPSEGVFDECKNFPGLSTLKISQNTVEVREIAALVSAVQPTLTSLSFNSLLSLSEEVGVQNLSMLKKIELGFDPLSRDKYFFAKMVHLQEIALFTHITEDFFEAVERIQSLRSLTLMVRDVKILRGLFKLASEKPALEDLHLTFYNEQVDTTVQSQLEMDAISRNEGWPLFSHIKHLRLYAYNSSANAFMLANARSTSLQSLEISRRHKDYASLTGILEFVKANKSVRSLALDVSDYFLSRVTFSEVFEANQTVTELVLNIIVTRGDNLIRCFKGLSKTNQSIQNILINYHANKLTLPETSLPKDPYKLLVFKKSAQIPYSSRNTFSSTYSYYYFQRTSPNEPESTGAFSSLKKILRI